MRKNMSLFSILAATFAFSVASIGLLGETVNADGCVYLKKGDKYYPGYTKCCDTSGNKSDWTRNDGIVEKDWVGGCRWWLGR